MEIQIFSETDPLQDVIIHKPGIEVENMTPESAERALYSDILNLHIASEEYNHFYSVLKKTCRVYEIKELLKETLEDDEARLYLINKICSPDKVPDLYEWLLRSSSSDTATMLIEGVPMPRNTLTRFLSQESFLLEPLHNFFFMRDAASSVYDHIIINSMASEVRTRESLIMDTVFTYHPEFKSNIIRPSMPEGSQKNLKIEGGDIIIANKDCLLIGLGARTNTYGIDYLIECIKKRKVKKHIIVQELPLHPESFIHLDMVFTYLSPEEVMIYPPVILNANRYLTIHILVDNGKVKKIEEATDIPSLLKQLGYPVKLLHCGGKKDPVIQYREQWHSGANFFAIGPGKVLCYERNVYTLEELDKNGYRIMNSHEFLNETVDLADGKKMAIALPGDELSRGGGGCRCMTMPVARASKKV